MTKQTTGLRDRAVLVKFTDRCWVGGTIDKSATEQVEEANDAQKGTGHYWKRLIPKTALKERVNIGADARGFHDNQTLPWLGGGIGILPAANFDFYMKGMRARQQAAEEAVSKFLDNYDDWVEEARRTQGKLFDESAYPTKKQVKAKFGFEIDVMPLPNLNDWRVELTDEQVDNLRKEAVARYTDLQTKGVQELMERLRTSLDNVKGRLGDPKAIFRDSLIGNIRDLAELAGRLNYTGDTGIETIASEIKAKLAGLQPATLRSQPEVRANAAKAAGDIINKMAALMGGATALPAAKVKEEKNGKAKQGKALREFFGAEETPKQRKARQARERRAAKKRAAAEAAGAAA